MITQLILGILALAMRRSDFESLRLGRRTEAEDPRWKPALEVALGGLIAVIAVGLRLALAYGWLN